VKTNESVLRRSSAVYPKCVYTVLAAI
jgi:hypothetical protein